VWAAHLSYNSAYIADYLSAFTSWRPYQHRVLAKVGQMVLPIPINIDTVTRLYGLDPDPDTIANFRARESETRGRSNGRGCRIEQFLLERFLAASRFDARIVDLDLDFDCQWALRTLATEGLVPLAFTTHAVRITCQHR
jgi:hypothetical protein